MGQGQLVERGDVQAAKSVKLWDVDNSLIKNLIDYDSWNWLKQTPVTPVQKMNEWIN